jgi:hypothetical protein
MRAIMEKLKKVQKLKVKMFYQIFQNKNIG